jgi:phosphoribosylamine-glycine ligase
MKFLVFDEEAAWTGGAFRLQEMEGHDVRIFCTKEEGKEHLQGIVKQVGSWGEGLRWVGKDGYIICGDESDMTWARKMGFKVYGANGFLKKMENDRIFEMDTNKKAGLDVPNYHHVKSVDDAIRFIKSHPDQWVLKQIGHAPKTWSYVGREDDGRDIIDQLEWIKSQPEFGKFTTLPFILQEFIEGIEFAVAGWWMGHDWKRDDDGKVLLCLSREHKKEGDGDQGRTTGEMGTVGLISPLHTKLFEQTVEKLTPVLRKECPNVCLRIDANCGVTDEKKAYLMEITPREGYPICALEQYMITSGIGRFFADLIDGKQGGVKYREDWGVVTVLGCGRFPGEEKHHEGSFKDQPVEMDIDEHVAVGYVKWDEKRSIFKVADWYEDIAQFSYHGDIVEANKKCVEAMKKVVVRAPHYRTDIGTKFVEKELPVLKKRGYL